MRAHFAAALAEEGPQYAFLAYVDLVRAAAQERGSMMFQDVSFALRTARKSPLFTTIVVATMALAIGANIAVYSVLSGVVLKPLPYAHPDRLVFIRIVAPWSGAGAFSLPDARDVGAQQRTFDATALYGYDDTTLLGYGPPKLLSGEKVSYQFFDVFEAHPELGRFFSASDEPDGKGHLTVISDQLWRSVFHGDPDIVGKTVRLSDTASRIVGVAPASFLQPGARRGRGFSDTDYWSVYKAHDFQTWGRGNHSQDVIARLKPGVAPSAATADLQRIFSGLSRKYLDTDALSSAKVVSARDEILGDVRSMLFTIFAVVAGVLLIACVNVANLLLSRAAVRERELSVRFAVGASRARIVAQLFSETLLYVGTGAALGLGLAALGLHAFVGLRPAGIPRIDAISVNANVVLYAIGLVAVATVLAGLVPALGLSRPDLSMALKSSGRGADSSRGSRLRSALVVLEIALALVLATTSGLSLRSYLALTNRPTGIDPAGVFAARISGFSEKRYAAAEATRNFQRAVIAKLDATPGVQHAAFAFSFPFAQSYSSTTIAIPGEHVVPGHDKETVTAIVSPETFAVLGVPLLRGRTFDERDAPGSAPVAIVNQEFVKRYFPGSDGIGKIVRIEFEVGSGAAPYRRVVGVVANTRHDYSSQIEPAAYMPAGQEPFLPASLIVRSSAPRQAVSSAIARVVASVDPTLEAPRVQTLRERMADSVDRSRFGAILLAILAGIALFLAVAGVYGVVSYDVGQRTHEIGIRVALGATTRTIVAMVLRSAALLAAAGIAIGLGLAACSSRLIEGQLVDIGALDPRTYFAVAALLGLAVFFASLIPALRAARVDPVKALRYE